jgi:hypothetical protein
MQVINLQELHKHHGLGHMIHHAERTVKHVASNPNVKEAVSTVGRLDDADAELL